MLNPYFFLVSIFLKFPAQVVYYSIQLDARDNFGDFHLWGLWGCLSSFVRHPSSYQAPWMCRLPKFCLGPLWIYRGFDFFERLTLYPPGHCAKLKTLGSCSFRRFFWILLISGFCWSVDLLVLPSCSFGFSELSLVHLFLVSFLVVVQL